MTISPIALLTTIQLNLVRRPLWPTSTVEDCLDIFPRKLTAMLDSGEIPWAWDLAAGRTRKEIRILAHCVVEKAMGPIPAIGATRNLNLPEVIGIVLPQARTSLRGVELQRLFHVSPNLIRDLSAAKEIKQVSEKLPAVGSNASPRFTRESVASLLEKRRLA